MVPFKSQPALLLPCSLCSQREAALQLLSPSLPVLISVKQNAIVPEESADCMAMAAADTDLRLAFPPPRPAGRKKLFSQLDVGGGAGAWVDSMRASSPTQARAAAASFVAAGQEQLESWMREHPSALSNFDEAVSPSQAKRIVLFLDYDGTLSPIVDDPDRAFMSDAMRDAVRDAAKNFPTAIVSGRSRDKVFRFVQLQELYYAGSHGMDIKGPTQATCKQTKSKAKAVLFQPASEFLPMIDEVYKALLEKTKFISGSRVENNTFSLSVHFRCVQERKWNLLAEQVRSVLEDYPKLELKLGRMVLEIRPIIEWNKGKALEFLLDSLGFAHCDDVFPVYIGDDTTDEDAFKVLRDRGQGLGILVTKFAKKTSASYSLRDPAEVMEFLHRLVEWRRRPSKK